MLEQLGIHIPKNLDLTLYLFAEINSKIDHKPKCIIKNYIISTKLFKKKSG